MTFLRRYFGFFTLTLAAVFLVLLQMHRSRSSWFLAGLEGWSVSSAAPSAVTKTGWADESRRLVPAEPVSPTVDVVREGQQSPAGDVSVPAVYQLSHGVVARAVAWLGGIPHSLAVERAVWWTDPAWQMLGLLGGALLAWRWRGSLGMTIFAVAWCGLYPLSLRFWSGVADPRAAFVTLAVLQMLAVGLAKERSGRAALVWAALGGVLGGLAVATLAEQGSWLIVLAGFLLLPVGRAATARSWAWSGAAVVLMSGTSWAVPGDVGSPHWSLALAWVGFAELLVLVGVSPASYAAVGLRAAGALTALVPWMFGLVGDATGSFWRRDEQWARLPGPSSTAWGGTWNALAAGGGAESLLPVALSVGVVVAIFVAWRRREFVGTALVSLAVVVLAWIQLRWWPLACGALAVHAVASTASLQNSLARVGIGLVAAISLGGLGLVWQTRGPESARELSIEDGERLILRDVGHWLRRRAGNDAAFWAPPASTPLIEYAGNLRGLGGIGYARRDEVLAALRIANATSPDEAQELLSRRSIRFLLLPSWDRSLDDLVLRSRGTSELPPAVFLAALRRWEQPRWLRPIPYPAPAIAGLEGRTITVFEVVEEQDESTAMARLAEYFAETGDRAGMSAADDVLSHQATDLGALVARGVLAMAVGDSSGFRRHVAAILPLVEVGAGAGLPWDRQVSLAVVLAEARQYDAARTVVAAIAAEADEEKMRALSPTGLLRLLVLSRRAGVDFADPSLEEWALKLLPEAARAQVPARSPARP